MSLMRVNADLGYLRRIHRPHEPARAAVASAFEEYIYVRRDGEILDPGRGSAQAAEGPEV